MRCVPMTISTLPCFDALRRIFLLFGVAEAAHHFNGDGKGGEAALEVFKMLEDEHRGRRQDRHLLVVLHGFEGRAHGDFRLAIADVATEQAVHGQSGFHVALDVGRGSKLIVCLVELKRVLKFLLPLRVRAETRGPARLCARRRA